jgi:tetratricopeptide (TPR) repeat protein
MRSILREARALPVIAGLILVVAGVLPAAQSGMGRGRVSGDVKDESGATIEGALITARSLAVDAGLETKSDKKGHFALAGFGTGTWRFTVSKEGYQTLVQDVPVHQLRTNPPLALVLKKATGVAALQSDKEGLASLDQGNALLAEGRFEEAAGVFEQFLAKYPEIYQARLNLASARLKLGDTARADAEFKAVLEKALPADPASKKDNMVAMRALSGLGETALKTGDLDSAQMYFARALDISPQDEAAAYNVGEIFFSDQKTDEAIRYFEMAVGIRSTWPKPYHRLGLVYMNKGDYAKALENLRKFIELDPESPEAPNVKSIIETLEKMKKQEEPA